MDWNESYAYIVPLHAPVKQYIYKEVRKNKNKENRVGKENRGKKRDKMDVELCVLVNLLTNIRYVRTIKILLQPDLAIPQKFVFTRKT